jgi:DNA polymerase (family 10)
MLPRMTFSSIQHTVLSWFSFRRGQRFYLEYKEKKKSRRIPLDEAQAIADDVLSRLATNEAVIRYSYSGSLRRMKETVGDIDMIAVSNCPDEVVEAFLSLPQWAKRGNAVKKGELRKARAWTSGGIPVELWVSPPAMYGAALLALSGSAFHVDELYKRALQVTYGVVLGSIWHWCTSFTTTHHDLLYLLRNITDGQDGMSEEKLYEFLGMQWVPPPLRKGKEEVSGSTSSSPGTSVPAEVSLR